MTDILSCCPPQSLNQPYIGVDQKCTLPAIFCIDHFPHKNQEGLMHQMLPLKHFKKTLQQKKFKMNQKISVLIDQYNLLMDSLIQQIRELKLRKNIQLSMLWLRQLAKDEEQYELMRQVYRMDFKDLNCALVHSIYFKIVHNQILQKKSVKQIDCYKSISEVLDHLSGERQTRSFLSKKITQIEGILQNGQILKRALPDKVVFKQNIKQVLLESPNQNNMQIKYNKCKIIKPSRQYMSIFSKYSILPHTVYHINLNTKYTNVMIGICTEVLVQGSKQSQSKVNVMQNQQSLISNQSSGIPQYDKHYSKQSIVFNCTNGCIYKDGMFQSGSNSLTKGQKQIVLKLKIISTNQLIITIGKNILCRQKIDNISINSKTGKQNKLFLHILMRTEGDSFDVDRDKDLSSDQLLYKPKNIIQQSNQIKQSQKIDEIKNINYEEIKRRNQQEALNIVNIKKQILQKRQGQGMSQKSDNQSFSYDFRHLNSSKLLKKDQHPSSLPFILPDTKSQQNLKEFRPQIQRRKMPNQLRVNIDEKKSQKSIHENIKNMNEQQKQKKINQLIKKQRIDKILNDIKSKPNYGSAKQNPVVAKKLKEIEQKNVIKQTPTWKNNQNIRLQTSQITDTQQQKKSSSNDQVNYIINYNKVEHSNDNLDEITSNNNYNFSNIQKSMEINPLLMVKKPPQSQNSQQSIGFPSAQGASSIQITQNKSSANINNQNKIKPYQKSFKLCQDQSYNFQQLTQNHNISQYNDGGFTPIDKINQFEFAKKSGILKSSFNQHEMFKPQLQTQKNISKNYFSNARLAVQQQSSENIEQSGSFYKKNKSQVIQSIQIPKNQNIVQNKANVNQVKNEMKLPQLQHSHFSKLTSKSNPHDNISNVQSSFGFDNRSTQKKANIQDNEPTYKQNNENKPFNLLQSIINLKSQNMEQASQSSIHIGNIISPKNKNQIRGQNKGLSYLQSESSQVIQESFQMGDGWGK